MSKKHESASMPGKYKVTLKIFDEEDRCVYLRLPPKASWFILTSSGTVDDRIVDLMFQHAKKADLPDGARPVFKMPTLTE